MEGIQTTHHHPHHPHHGEAADILENKDLAALSYVWVLSVVVHFSVHHSPFTKFHCRQALILFALSILVSFIPYVGILLLLAIAALSVMGFVNAAQGLHKDLPLVGPIARADIPELRRHVDTGWQWLRGKMTRTKPRAPHSHPTHHDLSV